MESSKCLVFVRRSIAIIIEIRIKIMIRIRIMIIIKIRKVGTMSMIQRTLVKQGNSYLKQWPQRGELASLTNKNILHAARIARLHQLLGI